MNISQILAIIVIFVVSSTTEKVPPKEELTYTVPLSDLEFMDQVLTHESVGECMCPAHANYTGTWFEYCGRELTPPTKCTAETIYRCVNNRKVAIQTRNHCAKTGKRCVPKTQLEGGPCPMCKPHILKTCIM
ncbi:hypothetical protein Fcan01_15647 [Folsomia candida]|uniref:Uncharacterized protein n=1 Tax=Folsomia candida TaxID=158441 RepID=A0A226DV42_FOLCA|nr:hypothetical protein Fcan01_15647 [Folsomia candida]